MEWRACAGVSPGGFRVGGGPMSRDSWASTHEVSLRSGSRRKFLRKSVLTAGHRRPSQPRPSMPQPLMWPCASAAGTAPSGAGDNLCRGFGGFGGFSCADHPGSLSLPHTISATSRPALGDRELVETPPKVPSAPGTSCSLRAVFLRKAQSLILLVSPPGQGHLATQLQAPYSSPHVISGTAPSRRNFLLSSSLPLTHPLIPAHPSPAPTWLPVTPAPHSFSSRFVCYLFFHRPSSHSPIQPSLTDILAQAIYNTPTNNMIFRESESLNMGRGCYDTTGTPKPPPPPPK
ncbi:hypothetical protein HBH79_210840 [Parastagonospora nodorum]|nr:hypothetical protein HBH51_224640 [Parastagonospora nodorum]KAH4094499.1 hypothetical protein HBH46_173580 [Parastagonospora nodorum]KAH4141076.1 hypothetical protein HBH45_066230 [Parastagonospora nodorum]KAH4157062.1 hypothetical protein HBH43_202290 [Parastagonospora nodorum]KAH4322340.1 hypothetical protein HBI00_199240 [Parastagonospora nodorum]